MKAWTRVAPPLAAGLLAACGGSEAPAPLTREELMDPAACKTCHPDHYREWSGSMHAYAAEDPVFLAMNRRGQRETKGELGDFCVNCHAPMAVRAGATKDGLDLDAVPQHLKGVTCYFCHSVAEVTGTHDNPLELADDGVLRGAIADPASSAPHRAAYSKLHDREQPEAASLCGSCHDIVTPGKAHVERTFDEWKGTLFSRSPTTLTCGQCHMTGRDGLAAEAEGTGVRRVHAHDFPGVDVALTPFPEMESQRAAVQSQLDTTLQAALCLRAAAVKGQGQIQIVLDNVGAGHSWPSGATPDRRAWVEVKAFAKGKVVYTSGAVAKGEDVLAPEDEGRWLFRDCVFDANGKETKSFWEAASFESNQLPGPVTNAPNDPKYYLTHVVRKFPRPASPPVFLEDVVDRVTMRVRMVPIGYDVLDELVESGDLAKEVRSAMPEFSLAGTELEWSDESATIRYVEDGFPVSCVSSGLSTGANSATPAREHTRCKR